jgi:outer membrane protein TolC
VWSDLRNSNGRIWSGGADLSVPVFEGGQAWYGRKAAVDAYRAARADYQQVVLTAFQQVADTLRALEHDAELMRDSGEARAATRDALALTDANYRAGLADYLALMTATQAAQGAEVGYLGASAQRLQDTVALYVALGGGWWAADPAAAGAR